MSIFLRYALFICLIVLCPACVENQDSAKVLSTNEIHKIPLMKTDSKIDGVSFVASRDSLLLENIKPLKDISANFAAIMPFGFIKSLEHPEVIYDQEGQWYGETKKGAKQYIDLLHKNNVRLMMKPQIWVWRGEFTGMVSMVSEFDWIRLEDSYTSFIIDYAKLAQNERVEIFCIGTELEKFIEHRPEYWRELILEIRSFYHGKLTYAANWDEYKRVPFWDMLDYIGIDAYFPISEEKTPNVEEVKVGWKIWRNELKKFSDKENKKILFTEYGYRSYDFSGKEPWRSEREISSVNLEAQTNLLEGFYQSVWEEEWFAGGFLWKWFISHVSAGGDLDNQFTPQNKPAEVVVKNYYSKN